MKNSDCVYPTLLRLKLVVPGSTMAPFPPVTGPVTVGFAAEGAGRRAWALLASAVAAAVATSTEGMVTAATAAAIRRRQRGLMGFALMAGAFHDGPGMRPGLSATERNAAQRASQASFSQIVI
jgi:hypothetical protein